MDLQGIADDAAFLVAALLDPTTGHDMKTREVLSTIEDLLPKLEAVGLMADYHQAHGGYGLWPS